MNTVHHPMDSCWSLDNRDLRKTWSMYEHVYKLNHPDEINNLCTSGQARPCDDTDIELQMRCRKTIILRTCPMVNACTCHKASTFWAQLVKRNTALHTTLFCTNLPPLHLAEIVKIAKESKSALLIELRLFQP